MSADSPLHWQLCVCRQDHVYRPASASGKLIRDGQDSHSTGRYRQMTALALFHQGFHLPSGRNKPFAPPLSAPFTFLTLLPRLSHEGIELHWCWNRVVCGSPCSSVAEHVQHLFSCTLIRGQPTSVELQMSPRGYVFLIFDQNIESDAPKDAVSRLFLALHQVSFPALDVDHAFLARWESRGQNRVEDCSLSTCSQRVILIHQLSPRFDAIVISDVCERLEGHALDPQEQREQVGSVCDCDVSPTTGKDQSLQLLCAPSNLSRCCG